MTAFLTRGDPTRQLPAEAGLDDEPLNGQLSRRRFLKITALASALALTVTTLAGCSEESTSTPHRAFFYDHEYAFVEAATSRLIPSDAEGPGAREAAVAVFIDSQLAGGYGRADRWYMMAPFHEGMKEQGYQLPLTPAQLYRASIAEIDGWCHNKWNKAFAALSADQQDQVLHQLQDGKIPLSKLHGGQFFDMLWQNTQEGFLADPIYGGNKDFAGWALIGFPGPRYNYLDDIEKWGQRYTMPYVSIGGERAARQPQNTRA